MIWRGNVYYFSWGKEPCIFPLMSTIIVCPSCKAKNRIPAEKQNLRPKCGRCGYSLSQVPPSGQVNALTDQLFQERVEQADLPVLVDFYSPNCGPSQMLAPVLEQVARNYAGKLMVYKLDTSSQQMQATRFQIRGVPTLLFFKDGRIVDQLVGAVPQAEIEGRINAML